jgi:hypothetical protein
MRCEACAAEIPADGKFCIECGAPVRQAARGAIERLPDYAGGQHAQSGCSALLCWRSLAGGGRDHGAGRLEHDLWGDYAQQQVILDA